MSFMRTISRIARLSEQYGRTAALISKRGYVDAPSALSFTFATPAECFYQDANVKQIDVPSLSGDFGILAQHVPTLAALKPGVVVVHEDDAATKYFVSSGSVTVNDDSSVQILAEEAVPLDSESVDVKFEWQPLIIIRHIPVCLLFLTLPYDKLDSAAVREGLSKAQQEVSSASTDKAKAEAQIAVECYEAMVKALE